MIASDAETGRLLLTELIDSARVVLPFTGAGISTESGIPDFRSPGGLWAKYRPISFDEFVARQDARDDSWRRRFAMEAAFAAARPGRGHRALASLYHAGKAPAVVTQNIDNLHQHSGIGADDVIELHGNTTYAACLDCGRRYEIAWVHDRFIAAGERAPACDCGGFIKTATISFGQPMPGAALRRAEALIRQCDLFLVIGSSLVVWPAAGLPLLAKQSGARLAILNREPTEFDAIADLVIHDDIGDTLASFVVH